MRRSLLLFALLFMVGVACFADSIRVCVQVSSNSETSKASAGSLLRRELRQYSDVQIVPEYDETTDLFLFVDVIEPAERLFVLYVIVCWICKPEYGSVFPRLVGSIWFSGDAKLAFEETCKKVIYWFDNDYVEPLRTKVN